MTTVKELFNDGIPHHKSLEFWEQQKDGVVYSHIEEEEWIDDQLSALTENPEDIRSWLWNPTSMGNLAFLALKAPRVDQRTKCMKVFMIATRLLISE